MTDKDLELFKCDDELSKKIDSFLDRKGIKRNLKGRIFLKDMIIYQTNKKIYQKEINRYLYQLISEKYKTSYNNVVRQCRYACTVNNLKEPIYVIDLMLQAWYLIKLKKVDKRYENIKYRCLKF